MAAINEIDKNNCTSILDAYSKLIFWAAENPKEERIDGKPGNTPGGVRPTIYFRLAISGERRLFSFAGDTKRSAIIEWMKIISLSALEGPGQALYYTENSKGSMFLRLASTKDPKNKSEGFNCREVEKI